MPAVTSLSSGGPRVPGIAPATRLPPPIGSGLAAAIDVTNGRVLYEKAAHRVTDWPASTVKAMTALLVAEAKAGVLDSETVAWQASDDLAAGYSQVGLQVGDGLTWRDLLRAVLLVSAGDAAQAAARIIGNERLGNADRTRADGYAAFVAAMNERASALGVARSRFVNGHGADRHAWTARDLAVVAGAAFSHPVLQAVCATPGVDIAVTGPSARTVALSASNPVLTDAGVLGGKTGSLILTGIVETWTLVTLWRAPSGADVAIATLGAPDSATRYADTRAMIAALPADFPYLAT